MLRAARAYIGRLGFELVIADSRKVPLRLFFPHGASDATRNLDRLERALASDSAATLAARVGAHTVLDVDTRHGGHEQLAKLLARYGTLPKTWQQVTPSGGLHIWFQTLGFKPRGRIAPGIEVLTGNRLVTLSPSMREGRRYRWTQHPLQTELAEAPRWLVALAEPPPAPPRPEVDNTEDPAVREKRARAYIATMDGAISGQHGHARTFFAAVVATRGFNLDTETAFKVLFEEFNPKCDPAWTERELKRKVHEAVRRGSMAWGAMLERRDAA